MTRAAGRILDAAERALNAFASADSRRDAADARYHAAIEQRNAVTVNCDNFNCGDNDLVDHFDGLEDAYARSFEALSALSAANASYVEAVGIAGAGEARERAARFRRFANRMRGLGGGSSDMVRRSIELIAEVGAEIAPLRALHSRATAAHVAANRAALDALGRAGRTLSTAAGRLTDDYYPATRAAEVTREAAALDRAVAAAADPEVSNGSDRTDAALDELILAAREVYVVLESHVQLVEQAAREYERDPEPALPGRADVDRPADVESEPAGDFAGWVRQDQRRGRRGRAGRRRGRAGRGGVRQLVLALVGVHQRRGTRGAGEHPRPEPHVRGQAPRLHPGRGRQSGLAGAARAPRRGRAARPRRLQLDRAAALKAAPRVR